MAGVVWAIAAAIVWSLGNISAAKGLPTLGVVRSTLILLVVSAVLVGVVVVARSGPSTFVDTPAAAMGYFAASGLFHYFAGWGFMNTSIRMVGPSRMSAITGVTPLFAVAFALLTLGESLNPLIGAGILLIVIGTYFIAVS